VRPRTEDKALSEYRTPINHNVYPHTRLHFILSLRHSTPSATTHRGPGPAARTRPDEHHGVAHQYSSAVRAAGGASLVAGRSEEGSACRCGEYNVTIMVVVVPQDMVWSSCFCVRFISDLSLVSPVRAGVCPVGMDAEIIDCTLQEIVNGNRADDRVRGCRPLAAHASARAAVPRTSVSYL